MNEMQKMSPRQDSSESSRSHSADDQPPPGFGSGDFPPLSNSIAPPPGFTNIIPATPMKGQKKACAEDELFSESSGEMVVSQLVSAIRVVTDSLESWRFKELEDVDDEEK